MIMMMLRGGLFSPLLFILNKGLLSPLLLIILMASAVTLATTTTATASAASSSPTTAPLAVTSRLYTCGQGMGATGTSVSRPGVLDPFQGFP